VTLAYSNGVAVFGSTDLDGLASSSSLVAGWQSAVIVNSVDTHGLSGRFKANASTPTPGVLEVWAIPVWDIGGVATYPDTFGATSSARTVTYRNVLPNVGELIAAFITDATANRVYEFSGVDIGALFDTMLQRYIVFVTHNMVTALNASANAGGQCWNQPITF